MITIDKRLKPEEVEFLQQLIGQELISVKHDEFLFSFFFSQVVGFEIEDCLVYLYSFTESADYFGSIEDVAVWELSEEKYPFVDNKSLISSPVKETIKEIHVVQENQQLFEDGQKTYDVWVTRGIIIDFGDYQYSFEKPVWFSTDIYIQKGYSLIDKFASVEKFENDDWSDNCIAKCNRETIVIKK